MIDTVRTNSLTEFRKILVHLLRSTLLGCVAMTSIAGCHRERQAITG
jgi:hypothetical protein